MTTIKRILAAGTLAAMATMAAVHAPAQAAVPESKDGRGRAKQAGIVPDNPLHSRHPWRSDARADESRDGRGRAKQDARAEQGGGRRSEARRCGGIGRHAVLRGQCLRVCRFESGHRHQ